MYTFKGNGEESGLMAPVWKRAGGKGHCLAGRFVRFLGQRLRGSERECSSLSASRLVYGQSIEGHTWDLHSVLLKGKR